MLADESARRYKRPLPILFWREFASSCASLLPASSSYGSVSTSIPVVASGRRTETREVCLCSSLKCYVVIWVNATSSYGSYDLEMARFKRMWNESCSDAVQDQK